MNQAQNINYHNKRISLSEWPDLTQTTPTPMLISMCNKLLFAPCLYMHLLQSFSGNEKGIDSVLDELKRADVLVLEEKSSNIPASLLVTKAKENQTQDTTSSVTPESKKNKISIYNKMKNFLKIAS